MWLSQGQLGPLIPFKGQPPLSGRTNIPPWEHRNLGSCPWGDQVPVWNRSLPNTPGFTPVPALTTRSLQ